jgi:NAD(P)-dependent dehydrogenase (short-subunit alcohol dehydrogenase family)
VYATARRPELIDLDGVERLALDITSPASVATAAAVATDVDLLVNNAGIATTATLLGDLDAAHADMDTNVWGTLCVIRAFAPVLAANGGGSIVDIASGASWLAMPGPPPTRCRRRPVEHGQRAASRAGRAGNHGDVRAPRGG